MSSVVIDNGSWSIKAGLSNEKAPHEVFATMVGAPRRKELALDEKPYECGDTAARYSHILRTSRPIDHGIVTDMENMERIWGYAFEKLEVPAKENSVLLSENVLNPVRQREKMTTIMFETFSVARMYAQSDAVLSLYSSGRMTGVGVTSGLGTTVAPIYEGFKIHNALAPTWELGGSDISEYLYKLLVEAGNSPRTPYTRFNPYEDMKKTITYVALDFDAEMKSAADSVQEYTLPDGLTHRFRNALNFRTPEAMFQPRLIGLPDDETGLHVKVHEAVAKCDAEIQKQLYHNIVLSGGNTLFRGFPERLAKELKILAPEEEINIAAPPEREFSTWIGGSILASLDIFKEMCITKDEYEECGPVTVMRKCL